MRVVPLSGGVSVTAPCYPERCRFQPSLLAATWKAPSGPRRSIAATISSGRGRRSPTLRHCVLNARIAPLMMQRFNISERDLQPGRRDIQVEGELDLAVVGRLDEVLAAAIEQCSQVLVGLERCAFIDSSGIAVSLRAHSPM